MRRLVLSLLALALLPIFRVPASAQMSNMPEDLRTRLAEINPTWGKDILGNVATTLALYTPLLAAAPKDGVRIERDLAYGPDALHRLDLHKQEGCTGIPIAVFLHGALMSEAAGTSTRKCMGTLPPTSDPRACSVSMGHTGWSRRRNGERPHRMWACW